MINLIEQLSDTDKNLIDTYVKNTDDYIKVHQEWIGVDDFLSDWNKEKKTLYRLLGGSLLFEKEISVEKSQKDFEREIFDSLLVHELSVKLPSTVRNKYFQGKSDVLSVDIMNYILSLFRYHIYLENKIFKSFKLSKAQAMDIGLSGKKGLQIPAGMQPIRAIKKIISFFEVEDELNELFEDFRIKHSIILNDKYIRGTLVFSIHPLDFITMSDNSCDWSSCMSWKKSGCYHAGTVEMMNSNNTLCCYLKSEKPFTLDGTDFEWNSKRWRVLGYVTPEIIVNGYPYPYINDALSKIVVSTLRELAQKNLGWKYQYGLASYEDMRYINSGPKLETNRLWRVTDSRKGNILFDTKMMYNDFLNKGDEACYFCVRNEVKGPLIISASGKAKCLACGESLQEDKDELYYKGVIDRRNNDYDHDGILFYNDRYFSKYCLCQKCLNDSTCELCDKVFSNDDKKIFIKYNHKKTVICENCYEHRVRECPSCKENFLLDDTMARYHTNRKFKLKMADKENFIDNIRSQPMYYINGKYYTKYAVDALIDNVSSIKETTNIIADLDKLAKSIDMPKGLHPICSCSRCRYKRKFSKEVKNIKLIDFNEKYDFLMFKRETVVGTYSDFYMRKKTELFRYENLKKATCI